MPNVINLVEKFLPLLDEQYKMESKSAILDVNPAFVQMTKDAKKVKIAKFVVDGLANYSRANGFVTGYAELTWEEKEFTQDRGRAIQIDDMDNEETFGLAFGRLAGEFQRTQVTPEIDAYRFAKYYNSAYTKTTVDAVATSILEKIDEVDSIMDSYEVPEDGRILFVSPQAYRLMINDESVRKQMDVSTAMVGGVSKKFYSYNGHQIIKVPDSRFYTAITLKDGSSSGQESGGYAAASGASVIGFLMIHPVAVLQLAKRRIARIWAPTKEQAQGTDGVNPNADAWKFDYRVYHDAWTLDNKVKGIAGCVISQPSVTSVTITSTDITISANAATVSKAAHPTVALSAKVVGAGGADALGVNWSSSDKTKATVNADGVMKVLAAGTVNITATSKFDSSKSNTVAMTITA